MDKFLVRGSSVSAEKVNTEEPSLKLWNFDESYIKYGFMEYSDGRPQCTLCLKILSVEALKPYKLNRHLTTIHPEHANKSKDFSEKERRIRQTSLMHFFTIVCKLTFQYSSSTMDIINYCSVFNSFVVLFRQYYC